MRMLRDLSLLVLLCGIIVIIQSNYVGDLTIYSLENATKRAELHRAIVENEPYRGGWVENKVNGANIRILTVYAVEFAGSVTGVSHARLYKFLDMTTILATLVLLVLFLKKWFPVEYGLIAVLFLAALMPLTYAFHYFHPWDRPGVLLWLLFAWAVREDRIGWCALILFVSVLNKFDSVALPGLYFLAHVSQANWKTVALRTMGLFILSIGTYAALRIGIPDGVFPRSIAESIARNLGHLQKLKITYPPILGFALPLILVFIGWRRSDQFSRAAFVFGFLILIGPLMLTSHFQEIRTQIGVMVLMLPVALTGLQSVLARTGSANHLK
ncbi:MAG: hypothetical protein OEQ74_01800 [Gammaproteobacteria bacterium]|nr:hypothetical protein [Gammaproteobacteria bacterium]